MKAFLVSYALVSFSVAEEKRPNILFAIADDWGWPQSHMGEDSECPTPTLGRLSKEGVRFKHAYVASPSCAPSRAGILSGQQVFRLGKAANLYGPIGDGVPLYTDLLEKAGDDRSASLCFMCSLSLDRAGKFWRQQLEEVNKVSENIYLFRHASRQAFSKLFP